MKICLAASAGGHLDQLLRISSAWSGADAVFVTSQELARERLSALGPVHVIGECNRENPIEVARVFARCHAIARQERFDACISTGAAPGLLMCLAARAYGSRIIWVDSIANVERLSLSGRLVRPIADLILTQWPHLDRVDANVEFCGSIV